MKPIDKGEHVDTCKQCGRDRREVDGGDFDARDELCMDCDAAERDASVPTEGAQA